jgi:predicted dinucleotide-binding enzyme
MAEYRIYVVGADGHFVGCEPLVCGDDVEAIEKAKRLVKPMTLSFGAASGWLSA